MTEIPELVIELFLCSLGMLLLCILISFAIFTQRVVKQFFRKKRNAKSK